MVPNLSSMPIRSGRAAASGLPRPTATSSSFRAPPPAIASTVAVTDTVEDHQPVASTSKLPPTSLTPARSEYELSRLDWGDLLAEGDDLLNDESASWLVDQSAYTIGAQTPARASAVAREVPGSLLGAVEDGDEHLCTSAETVVPSLTAVKGALEKPAPTTHPPDIFPSQLPLSRRQKRRPADGPYTPSPTRPTVLPTPRHARALRRP